MTSKLTKDFYTRNVLTVARELLGKTFVFNNSKNKRVLSARIVEVEAYDGKIDEAAHTFIGKTRRNKIMFEEGGSLYVYFIYGKHFCLNIVTGKKDHGTAVLLRGMEPIDGIEIFGLNRYNKKKVSKSERFNLLNGPAKICQAFGITKIHNESSLLNSNFYLLDSPKIYAKKIVSTRRIGIKKSVELPWRFYIKDNPNVSKKSD